MQVSYLYPAARIALQVVWFSSVHITIEYTTMTYFAINSPGVFSSDDTSSPELRDLLCPNII